MIRIFQSLDRARCWFAALCAGLPAIPLGISWVAARPPVTLLAGAGVTLFVLVIALFAFVATRLAIKIVGTATCLRYLLALLLADGLFAGFVGVASWLVIGLGSTLDDPAAGVSLMSAVMLTVLVLLWSLVCAFVVAVPCSLVGALVFQMLYWFFRPRSDARPIASVFVLAFSVVMLASLAQAQSAAPTYTELLSFDGKADGKPWNLGDSADQGGVLTQEFVPAGQTVDDWSEMITIQTFKQRPDFDTRAFIARVVASFNGTCGGLQVLANHAREQTDDLRAAAHLPATYHTYDTLVRCEVAPTARPPGAHVSLRKYEVVWFKGIQGWLSAYLVQRAWHGDIITQDSILASDATRQRWQSWIDEVAISGVPDKAKP